MSLGDYRSVSAVFNRVINRQGFGEVVLDFSRCTAAFAHTMVGVASLCQHYREAGVTFSLREPKIPQLRNLFFNANWNHFIDPDHYPRDQYLSERHVPAMMFQDADAGLAAHKAIMRAILASLPELPRNHLKALEWCIWEITDNVVNHAASRVGGIVQVQTMPGRSRRVEITVVDAGVGIPSTLRKGPHRIRDDAHALELAIQEGVTSRPQINQGNGLFGTFQLAFHSRQRFLIESGRGRLTFAAGSVSTRPQSFPVTGTLIHCAIDTGIPNLLETALKFRGKVHEPAIDYVSQNIETDSGDHLFRIKDNVISVGSRDAGAAIRTQLNNIIRIIAPHKLIIDFEDISIVSSSFADEVFGKLFVQLGPLEFMQRISFKNVDATVQTLMDTAIRKRVMQDQSESQKVQQV